MRIANGKELNKEDHHEQRQDNFQFQPFSNTHEEKVAQSPFMEQIKDSLGNQFGENAKCISNFMPDLEALKKYSNELKSKVNEVVIEQTMKNITMQTSNEENKKVEESVPFSLSSHVDDDRHISPESVAEITPSKSEHNGMAVNSMSVMNERSCVLQKPEDVNEVQSEGESEKS